jgi:hypothetical protein
MMRRLLIVIFVVIGVIATGCSNADTVSNNVSKEAEKFKVQRKIVGYNGVTDKVIFEVEGKCSVEKGDSLPDVYDVICKHGPDDYRKHYLGLSDNVTFISTQLKGIDVSEYRTKVIIRPTSIVPDLDLVTGE